MQEVGGSNPLGPLGGSVTLEEDIIPKVGQPITDPPPPVFELVVDDHVKWVNPRGYGVAHKGINPANYFITSGDAVEKVRILERDLRRASDKFAKDAKSGSQAAKYAKALGEAAKQAARLLESLKMVRGTNVFLETEWSNHKLLIIPKNPRN
jgi:hypothetical protein